MADPIPRPDQSITRMRDDERDEDGAGALCKTSKATMLVALHDFESRDSDELRLHKGDIVELLERDDEFGDGWYQGRLVKSGAQGLFPAVYTAPAPADSKDKDLDMHSSPAEISLPAVVAPAISISTTKLARDTRSAGQELLQSSRSPSLDSTSSPVLAADEAPSATPPLTVEKVSGRTTPAREHSVVFVGESVEERAANYVQSTSMQSPVVQDTLSDIEEAISELHKGRDMTASKASSSSPPAPQNHNDSSSEYSVGTNQIPANPWPTSDVEEEEYSPLPIQGSFEAFDTGYTREDVESWSPAQVSLYLQSRDVPLAICEKFEDQEVSGSILLELEMAHLKELDIGSFGKRFQAWKQIRYLVDHLRPPQKPHTRQRSSTVGTLAPTTKAIRSSSLERPWININEANLHETEHDQLPGTATTIASSLASPLAGVFEFPRSPPQSPSRRHTTSSSKRRSTTSQHDSPATALNTALVAGTAILHAGQHHRDSSFDAAKNAAAHGQLSRPSTATGMHEWKSHRPTPSTGTGGTVDSGFSSSQPHSPHKVTERSYFSSGETPRSRKVLQKKSVQARHSRVGSSSEAQKRTPSTSTLSATMAYYKAGKDKHKRKSASFSGLPDSQLGKSGGIVILPASSTDPIGHAGNDTLDSEDVSTKIKTVSLEFPTSPGNGQSVFSDDGSAVSGETPTPTSSTKPSKKAERNKSSASHRIRQVSSGSGLRQKPKKDTTGHQKGLRNITPLEAAKEGDFSGWMQKRGSGGMSTWKPRFFVLSGRRLAYFYSERDVRERGLIDITSHKVLPATDGLIGLHAAFAAATTPSPSPKQGSSACFQHTNSPEVPPNESIITEKEQSAGGEKAKEKAQKEQGREKSKEQPKDPSKEKRKEKSKDTKDKGWFTFKLVPPGPGAAKGVTFTKPMTHYLATNSREEGRKWMGAIMKATIDRDETKPVVTSYSADTISLAKARMLRIRPPALLKDTTTTDEGLGIMPLDQGDEADVEDVREGEEASLNRSLEEISGENNTESVAKADS